LRVDVLQIHDRRRPRNGRVIRTPHFGERVAADTGRRSRGRCTVRLDAGSCSRGGARLDEVSGPAWGGVGTARGKNEADKGRHNDK